MMSLILKKKFLTTCILSLLSFILFGQVELEKHDNLNQDALRFWYSDSGIPSHKFNRNISPKGDCIQYANGYVFFTWYKGGMNSRNLMLSRLNTTTNSWVTIEFPDKNSLYTSGEYQGAGNSHRTTNIGVSTLDGTVHLLYDMHADQLKYRVSDKNIAFAPDNEFTLSNFSGKLDYFRPGDPISGFTYPSIQVNNEGELILEYRKGTSRQGDKYLIIYDQNGWSETKLVMQGNNENPEYNQYGGFAYFFGQLYMGSSVRIKGSPIEFNQGFYFASAGKNGIDQDWKDINDNFHELPIKGMNQMNKLKLAEPLPDGSNGMTSAPNFVVSKNRAVHFTNRVPGQGTVHYIVKPGSTTMQKASGSSPNVSFPADDGRIYSIGLDNDKIKLQSTKEGENNWRTDFNWSGSERFGLMSYEYKDGKIYMIVSEKKESDKLPLHYIVLKLEDVSIDPDIIGPEGYTYAVNESETLEISNIPYDVAYGQDGQYEYLLEQTEDLSCDNETFGNDPVNGVQKYCFIRESKAPFSGTPIPIPGIIEAENYDFGGAGRSYVDADAINNGDLNFREEQGVDIAVGTQNMGYAVGWTQKDEWLEYTIQVDQEGLFNFNFSVSSPNGTGVLGVDIDGNTLLTDIQTPQTDGWNDYTFFTETAQLPAGEHILRINVENSGFNLDKMEIDNNSLGINDLTKEIPRIHPNPSKTGLFRLSTKTDFKVYSINGKLLIENYSDQIDLSKYTNGIYILHAENSIYKILKTK